MMSCRLENDASTWSLCAVTNAAEAERNFRVGSLLDHRGMLRTDMRRVSMSTDSEELSRSSNDLTVLRTELLPDAIHLHAGSPVRSGENVTLHRFGALAYCDEGGR